MKRNHLLLDVLLLSLAVVSCQQRQSTVSLDGGLVLPENKVWAHRVNDTVTAQAKAQCFDGLELDLVYSPSQNQLFVGHNEEDTLNGLTLPLYLAALEHPERHYFWLDVKNLNANTADAIALSVKKELKRYDLVDRAFLESPDSWALNKVKGHGLHTSLWVASFYWSDIDTTSWIEKIDHQIETAHPDALSCEYRMFDALTQFYADQNLFLWHTPAALTPENAELTRSFCQHPSVKIVLVDYDKPISIDE